MPLIENQKSKIENRKIEFSGLMIGQWLPGKSAYQ